MDVSRKLRTFARNPRGSLSVVLRRHSDPLVQCWYRMMIDRAGLTNALTKRPPHAIPPDYADLWFLYHLVRTRRPRGVVEFGSGCSTIVIAEALARNALNGCPGRLYSLEAEPYWADVTTRSLAEHRHLHCEVIVSELEVEEIDGWRGYVHSNRPTIPADIVYVDGPALSEHVPVSLDVIRMEEQLPAGAVVVVDGRIKTVECIRENATRRFTCRRRAFFHNAVFHFR